MTLWDPAASSVARMIASAMQDVALRRVLKDEATLRFDGDYDVMFDVVRDRILPLNAESAREPMRVAELLATQAATPEGLDQRFWDGLVEHFPLLQISIPELPGLRAEDWDVEHHVPLVAFIPADYREGRDALIPAYDAQGVVHYLHPRIPPSELVVVVGQNERVIAQPKGGASSQKGAPELVQYCLEATASGSQTTY